MLNDIPLTVSTIFLLICGITLVFFLKILLAPLKASGRHKMAWGIGIGMMVWLGLQGLLAQQQFYLASFDLPPRALVALLPPMLLIVGLLIFLWRSEYFKQLSLKSMTYIQVFRLPLEFFVLSGLATAGYIPHVMTYYGRNPDIWVGLTAPIIAYLYFSKKWVSWKVLLGWHVLSLLLLINITSHAILSMPYPFQQVGLEQPNIGVFHFPYIWLPTLLVGVGYFCHIIAIHKLLCWREA